MLVRLDGVPRLAKCVQARRSAVAFERRAPQEGTSMNSHFRNFAIWVVIGLLLFALFNLFQNPVQKAPGERDRLLRVHRPR